MISLQEKCHVCAVLHNCSSLSLCELKAGTHVEVLKLRYSSVLYLAKILNLIGVTIKCGICKKIR